MKKLVILVAVLALAIAACGGSDSGSSDTDSSETTAPVAVGPGDTANGETVYDSTCIACHGEGGAGIDGLGKPMPGSEFIDGLSDSDLIAFIIEGRGIDHPDNTTGVEMPARGANTNLTDQDIADVVAFIRTL